MIRSILKEIVNSPVLFFGCFFLFRVSLWAPIERLWRARSVSYRRVAPRDFGAQLFHVFLVVPVVVYIYDRIAVYSPFYNDRLHLPLVARIALFLVISDLGYYWAHRLMHTGPLWRTHQWHHSPKYMYWLAGGRATIPHQFLVLFPYVLVAPITYPAPWWVFTLLTIFIYLVVDWMHLNVPWGGRVVEWFFVTPRYHSIHHSTDPGHYNFNLGNIFTFWDRLFGTHLDPATLNKEVTTFGIDDAPGAVRLIAGV